MSTRLFTVGHSVLSQDDFTAQLHAARIELLVDIRHYPGSRRHPHFARTLMEEWVPASGIEYRWDIRLGGRRKPDPDSPHVGLRHPSFRAYADYMESPEFTAGLTDVLAEAAGRRTAVMCSESLWWRCHRRMVSDAAVLLFEAEVRHIMSGRLTRHVITDCARRDGNRVAYNAGTLEAVS